MGGEKGAGRGGFWACCVRMSMRKCVCMCLFVCCPGCVCFVCVCVCVWLCACACAGAQLAGLSLRPFWV